MKRFALTLLPMAASLAVSAPVAQADTAPKADPGGPIFVARPRFESVGQSGKKDAEAYTARFRLGWETPEWKGLQGLFEIENVSVFAGDYNSGLNGEAAYAGISDPDVTELNRLQLAYSRDHATITVGRQRVVFDDQRFVGESNNRQDSTRFDAARLDLDFGKTTATYVYVVKVDRGLAEEADWDADTHLLNVSHSVGKPLMLTGFVYAIDLDEPGSVAALSNLTYGARATGEAPLAGGKLKYAATLAKQSDYGSSPNDFSLGLWGGETSWGMKGVTGRVAFTSIEGDGANRFATPIGSAHGVLGWADAFSAAGTQTTLQGIEDVEAGLSYAPDWSLGSLKGLKFEVIHHDFTAERTGDDLGSEWDAAATAKLGKGFSVGAKLATFDGTERSPSVADRDKVWVWLEYSL